MNIVILVQLLLEAIFFNLMSSNPFDYVSTQAPLKATILVTVRWNLYARNATLISYNVPP